MTISQTAPNVHDLSESLLFEVRRAMSLPGTKGAETLIRLLFGRTARKFSELALEFDRQVGQGGFSAGASQVLPHFVASHEARGGEAIPGEGPLLIVSNHPASYDGVVISAHVHRPDYRMIVGEIPPYRYLPHISRQIIFSPPIKNTFGRMQTVRNAIGHLKNGGALLIFPRGGIEADPAFMPNADAEFDQWSRSLEIFLERVPQTRVLVTIVSGVIAPAAFRHPITRLRKARPDRQRLAFIHQIIRQVSSGKELFGLAARVTFGELLSGKKHQHVLAEVEQSARRTLMQHLSSLLPESSTRRE